MRGTLRTASMVLTTMTMKQPSPASKTCPNMPIPNQRMKKGMRAIGGMGRSDSMSGSSSAKTTRKRLITRPTNTPSAEPARKLRLTR